jgi:protein TonB
LEYQSLHSAIQRIEPVVQKLVAARELIALKTSALQANLDILNFELDQERENFRETGPKGFKEAYFITFPEVFPGYLAGELPTEKLEQDIHKKEVADMETVYQFVEEPAEFPGGNVALNKFLTDNLRYPQAALEEEIEGRCYLQFIVDRTGMISNVEVRRGVLDCPECDKEAIRLVEAMPKWKPGKNNGKPVNSRFNLPVTFKLN